jgi:hypothetical protein
MSFEKPLREMIRRELDAALMPLQKVVGRLEQGLVSLETVRRVTGQLAPLLRKQGQQVVLQAAQVVPAPAKRGPAPAPAPTRAPPVAAPAPKAKAAATGGLSCAVIGCKRPSRSKGYCSAHYQKLRLLIRTGRRPKDWVDDARPQSARDMKLPRGRAAGGQRTPEPVKAKEAPKPKAWVRKKGTPGMVSLH